MGVAFCSCLVWGERLRFRGDEVLSLSDDRAVAHPWRFVSLRRLPPTSSTCSWIVAKEYWNFIFFWVSFFLGGFLGPRLIHQSIGRLILVGGAALQGIEEGGMMLRRVAVAPPDAGDAADGKPEAARRRSSRCRGCWWGWRRRRRRRGRASATRRRAARRRRSTSGPSPRPRFSGRRGVGTRGGPVSAASSTTASPSRPAPPP